MKNICISIFLFTLLAPSLLFAQEKKERKYPIRFSGSVQSDMLLFPQNDEAIGATGYEDDYVLTNTYVDLNLMSEYVDVGTRFEFLKFPLPGFEPDFEGWGFPYIYINGKYKSARLTIGDFYEQFGSGLILRSYQERSLGIDNSIRGARFLWQPYKGINLKLLGGKQRRYWEHNDSFVWGGDLELNLEQWFKRLEKTNTFLMLGGSFVSKHEKEEVPILVDREHKLNLPENVSAFDVRARLQKGGFSLLAEYAMKINDPSRVNNYIYKKGDVLLLSGSYSRSGMSIILQAKRSDNMSFRSRRSDNSLIASYINHLPAFSMQHTYALAALYPYATQPDGEWAFQGSFAYNFRRNTPLGGKYGTAVKLNASYIRSIDRQYVEGYQPGNPTSLWGTDGYKSNFFKIGDELYYSDINISIDKKFTRNFKLNFMYMNQHFNAEVVQNHPIGIIRSNIFVLEGRYQFNKTFILRGEAQYLQTKQDKKDWWYGMLELTILPKFMITVSDMYNTGDDLHYYKALLTFTHKSHLIQGGYVRNREGYDCSGGVCRTVPASKGFQLSYNFTF